MEWHGCKILCKNSNENTKMDEKPEFFFYQTWKQHVFHGNGCHVQNCAHLLMTERSFKHLTSKSPLSLNWIELKLCLALYFCFYKHHSNSTVHNHAKFVRINYELGINLNKLLLNEWVMSVLKRITWIISFFSRLFITDYYMFWR